MKRRPVVGALVAALLVLTACSRDEEPAPGLSGEITVVADSSLRDAFTELGSEFQDVNANARVEFDFAPSSEIDEKAEANDELDVVALVEGVTHGLRDKVDRTSVFASSRLAIYVPAGNPKGIQGLEDLARSDVSVALCESTTPCGSAGGDAVTTAGVAPASPSTHSGGKAALEQVSEGKADAALLLEADVPPGDTTVARVDLADQHSVVITYAVGRLRTTDNEPTARGFTAFVLSGEGQQVLRSFGFGRP